MEAVGAVMAEPTDDVNVEAKSTGSNASLFFLQKMSE